MADLASGPAAFPTPIGIHFHARGARYLVGRLLDRNGDLRGFAIWDGDAPGPPMERFALTPEGRDGALARFRELEANSTIRENTEPPVCPRCGSAMRVMSGEDRATNVVTGLVVGGIGLAALANTGPKRFHCTKCHVAV